MEKLATLLMENKVDYEIIGHEQPIRSAQEGADWFGIEVGQTAPTLILKSGEVYKCINNIRGLWASRSGGTITAVEHGTHDFGKA